MSSKLIGNSRHFSKTFVNQFYRLGSSNYRPHTLHFPPHQYFYQSRMNLFTISNSIKEGLTKHEIIPDLIPNKNFVPKGLLVISYGKDKEVVMGNTLKPEETQELPEVAFTLNVNDDADLKIEESDLFTLVVTDPDAPKKGDPAFSEYCHYVIKDLKLNSASSADANVENLTTQLLLKKDGKELVPYMGPGPPPKTGLHRYVFMLFKQKPGLSPEAPVDRPKWGTSIPGYGIKEYSAKYGLELLAVNFFLSQNKED